MMRLLARLVLVLAVLWVTGAATPALAQIDVPPPDIHETLDGRGVDLATGKYDLAVATVSVGPAGVGGLSDTYRMRAGHSILGGVSSVREYPLPTSTYIVTVMGQAVTFQQTGAGDFLPANGVGGTLTRSGTTFTYTDLDGNVAVFSTTVKNLAGMGSEALISSITRRSGEVITYHYKAVSGQYRVQSVTNTLGYQIHFEYGTSGTTVTAINNAVDACGQTAATCVTTRDWPSMTIGSGGVTDSLGRTTRWIGGAVYRPTATTTPSLTYTVQTVPPAVLRWSVVKTVSDGAGVWTYGFSRPTMIDPTEFIPGLGATTVTDSLGRTTTYGVMWSRYGATLTLDDMRARVVSATDGTGATTQYSYNDLGNLASITHPEGDVETWTYTARGDLQSWTHTPKSGSGLAPVSVTATYPATCTGGMCGRPTSLTDARGNVTDYTYDAAGNLLTETGPAPTPGAARPQTRYVWAQRYAWYKRNGSSTITRAATPVWVQVEQSQCMTGATC